MKRLLLLGASGSIGKQTLDIVSKHKSDYEIVALSVGDNISFLMDTLKDFKVSKVCIKDENKIEEVKKVYPEIEVYSGDEGLLKLVNECDYDVLVNALVGFVGFLPTYNAILKDHDVALANKESLVVGGELIKRSLKEHDVEIIPVDSEHSAIYQSLNGNYRSDIHKLIITASGGAFRDKSREELKDVTLKDALKHPNWLMGEKITVDSATMMNKGFEVIEAHYLFDVDYDDIEVVIHKESIIHSMVEYIDGSVIAELATADMRLPIQYALSKPHRLLNPTGDRLSLTDIKTLSFMEVDYRRFPLLALAYEVGKKKGNLCAVMNGANDIANKAFRDGEIGFLDIEDIIIKAVHYAKYKEVETVDDLLEANKFGNEFAMKEVLERKKR